MKKIIEGWIAKNKEPNEVIFCPGEDIPSRMTTYWFCGFTWSYCSLPNESFPELKFEDDPIKVEVTFEYDDTK